MFVALIVIIIAVLLARLDIRNKTNKNYGLISAFLLLTVFASIRYNWGNDYLNYLNYFIDLNSYSSFDVKYYRERIEGMEFGWVLINRLCAPLGFFGMIIVLTCLEYAIIYRFIAKYLERKHYWIAVLIFTMTFGLMITGVSMMRQFLAQCICLLAFEKVIEKKWWIALLLVWVATFFHTSAYIIIPVCFVGYFYKMLNNNKILFIIIVFLILFYLFGEYFLGGVFDNVFSSMEEFSRYEMYLTEEHQNFGIFGILRSVYDLIFMVVVMLVGRKLQNKERLILLFIYLLSFLFDGFANIAPLIVRVCFYFEIVGIVVLPIVFSSIENKTWKTLLPLSYVARITYGFISAFYNPIWHDHFYEYHTIFEAPYWM